MTRGRDQAAGGTGGPAGAGASDQAGLDQAGLDQAGLDQEVEILRRSAVMAPPGSRLPVLRELLLRLIARATG